MQMCESWEKKVNYFLLWWLNLDKKKLIRQDNKKNVLGN